MTRRSRAGEPAEGGGVETRRWSALVTAGLALVWIGGARWHVAAPVASVLVWPALGFWLHRRLRSGQAMADARAALAVWCGYVLTMASLLFAIWDGAMSPFPSATFPNGHPDFPRAHPPFGEHPVTARAGLPWPGVEGNPPYSFAADRIPFDMGVDALLVDCAFWVAVSWLLLRRRSRAELSALAAWSAWCSPLPILAGCWQLVVYFD